ncbi:MAG: peptidoglycan bridge formation glycyltransferase FemA/FemB family protein [Candidatus Abawacabacteria bacterium]|nr:peptidoglycan bridge formation glycyltransferase FemA/FemB family protein [Candidatus Abawacabacteria bacterium]
MLSKENIFQSSAWVQLQNSLPNREAGYIGPIHWTILPTSFGKRYFFINRPLSLAQLEENWPKLVLLARQKNCAYIKLEPAWEKSEASSQKLSTMGFHPAPFHIQPDTTLYLDLTLSLAELLKQMKPKGRYNIKIADKHKINYRVWDGRDTDIATPVAQFYALLETTAKRDLFGIHSQSYYLNFLTRLVPHSKLYLAYYQDQPIAGLIAVFYKEQAIYYYGASDSNKRNTMATYGLQWQVIQDAKNAGMRVYDFLGIAPEDSSSEHSWYGVTDFKKKFGGHVYQYPGTLHYPLVHWQYFILHSLKQAYYEGKKLLRTFKKRYVRT